MRAKSALLPRIHEGRFLRPPLYNTSDSQPLSSSFERQAPHRRRHPRAERDIPDGGRKRNATNRGEALSLVSKFNVRSGAREDIVITNNFASGMAARSLTRSPGSADSLEWN